MNLREETISKQTIFEGKIITVRLDTVMLPNGTEAKREIVEHPGGVAIVALDENENVYMVRQYRRPFDTILLELPAGKLNYGENPLECGIRELKEETGLVAKTFENLGSFMVSPGFCGEKIHIYLARGLSSEDMNLDEDEFLEVEKYPLTKLMDMIMQNQIEDGKTVIGIIKTCEFLRREK